jgi:predicted PurR-regulated permease PerM
MKVHIEIDTKTFIRFFLVVVGFALAAIAIYSARSALVIIGISVFLTLALNVPVSRLAKRLPGRSRAGAVALSYIVVIAILGSVVFLVIPPIVQQTAKFAQTIPEIVDTSTESWQGFNNLIDRYNLQPQVDRALDSIKDNASDWAVNIGQGFIGRVGSIFGSITMLIITLVMTFFMLLEGPVWSRKLWGFYSDQAKMEKHSRITRRMYDVVSKFVSGQITVSAIGATMSGLAVLIISFIFPVVPTNLAMPTAAVTFVLTLIPMFGATISGALVGILIAFNSLPAAITYIVFFIIYQQIENNVIATKIQARKIELSPLAVLTAATIGLYVFGILGGVIAIPVAGCAKVLLEEYFADAKKERAESVKPLNKIAKKILE